MDISEQLSGLLRSAGRLDDDVRAGEYLTALRRLGLVGDAFANLAGELCQWAYDEGATKREIAGALGVPVSTLRDMRRTVTP